jgi:hypothetical protein
MLAMPACMRARAAVLAECTVSAGGGEAAGGDGVLDPQDDVVAGAAGVVAEVVIEAQLGDLAGREQGDDLVGPAEQSPAGRGGALVVEVELHGMPQNPRSSTA